MASWAVWYAAAGCLPDSDGPEFVGSFEECEAWVDANWEDYERLWVSQDTYDLTVEPFEV